MPKFIVTVYEGTAVEYEVDGFESREQAKSYALYEASEKDVIRRKPIERDVVECVLADEKEE